MPPTLLAPDRQDTWTPVWYFEGAAWPQVFATRDIDLPGSVVSGDPFVVGDSQVGGDALVGGGAGSLLRQGYFRILNRSTVTRRLASTEEYRLSVDVQSVTVELANLDGALSGDYRGAVFALTAYDAGSGFLLETGAFMVSLSTRHRDRYVLEGTSLDLGIPEDAIPKGVIDLATWPLAVDLGQTVPWVFGNVVNLPLPYVREDLVRSEFDYAIRGAVAAVTALRRMTPNGAAPFVDISFDELEPYPGMAGALKNGPLEGWLAGATSAPDSWLLAGAGVTIAKNQTVGQVDEGATSASLTRVGTDCYFYQDLVLNTPTLPLSWWQGRTITLSMRVDATVASRGQIFISDLVGSTSSDFHTGSGLYETLSVTRTIDAAATGVIVAGAVSGGNTTVHFDDVRVYLKAKSWAEVLRPDLYLGDTALRFYLQQTDPSGSRYQIVADVNGLQPERNPVRASRTLLADVESGVGKTVDAATFDQAELDAADSYLGLCLLSAPAVFLDFDDEWGTFIGGPVVARDDSGHGRHGEYQGVGSPFNAAAGIDRVPDPLYQAQYRTGAALSIANVANYVEVPSDPGLDPTAAGWTLEGFYMPFALAGSYAIAEKMVGAVEFTGLSLAHQSGAIFGRVNASVSGLTSASIALTGADVLTWLYLCVRVLDGVLTLTLGRAGVLTTATMAYTGTLPSGPGAFRVGSMPTPLLPNGAFDKFVLYPSALSDAYIQAHALGEQYPRNLTIPPLSFYGPFFRSGVVVSTAFAFDFSEGSGTVVVNKGNSGQPNGVYVGGINSTDGADPHRATGDYNRAARYQNNPAQYAKVVTPTLSGTALTINVLYRPDALLVNSGIVEKTIGGVTNTSCALYQEVDAATNRAYLRWRVNGGLGGSGQAGGERVVQFPLVPEDVGRYMRIQATYESGGVALYRNGAQAMRAAFDPTWSTSYDAPVVTGSGDLFIGVLGTSGGVHIYPCLGSIDSLVIHSGIAFTAEDAAAIWASDTWYPGGLLVDMALNDQRQAQDWIKQVGQLTRARFGVTAAGAITCAVDTVAPTTILLEASDGPGDGDGTLLLDIGSRARPSMDDAARDLIVNYRRDLSGSGAYLRQIVRPISTRLNAQGQRIGRDRIVNLDSVRSDPAADGFASTLAARLRLDETVAVVLGPEARALREGHLVQLTLADMGYADAVLVAQEVTQAIDETSAVLREWGEELYVVVPGAFSVGAWSG